MSAKPDLDRQLLSHLIYDAESVLRLRPDLDWLDEDGVAEALEFAYEFQEQYGHAPLPDEFTDARWDDVEEPTTTSIQWVYNEIRDRALNIDLSAKLKEVARLDGSPHDKARKMVTEGSRILNIGADEDGWVDGPIGVLEAMELRSKLPKISFGFPEVDKHFGGGMTQGGLYFVCARTGMGKSWMLMHSMMNTFDEEKTAVMFTLELTPREQQERFVAMLATCPYGAVRNHTLSFAQKETVEAATDWYQNQDTRVHIGPARPGRRTVPELVERALEKGADALYIDQFYNLEPSTSRKGRPEWAWRGEIVHELKQAAEHFPIYCAAQLNRMAASRSKEEKIQSVRDIDSSQVGLTDAVPAIADLVLAIFMNKGLRQNRLFQFGSIKERSDVKGAWVMHNDLSLNSCYRTDEWLEE